MVGIGGRGFLLPAGLGVDCGRDAGGIPEGMTTGGMSDVSFEAPCPEGGPEGLFVA